MGETNLKRITGTTISIISYLESNRTIEILKRPMVAGGWMIGVKEHEQEKHR